MKRGILQDAEKITRQFQTRNGDTSYSNNSAHQKIGILKSWIVLDEILKDMFTDNGFPKCFKMADLGCSSGPNSFFVISHIINKVQELSEENKFGQSLVFQVFLNDLPGNDFNNLFKMLPTFYQKLNPTAQCFVSGVPGSFYGRLFPSKSLDFVYSSFSLQWLSQVPPPPIEGGEATPNRGGRCIEHHCATTMA
ncbi:UNVERIFIED_CONTAM: Benzoate carboxyl methyltransferase [Sesamum angustifolium]|uniref:Benzoate carboxyl methyltransferase n=1 Tax=Sesamum angustifolium TaxID=2727405 RepID=A0AAW2N6M5_9LAMI